MKKKDHLFLGYLFYFFSFIGLLIMIYLCVNSTIDLNSNTDEAFTLRLINHSLIDIVRGTALDVHPPLYYLILKLFVEVTNLFSWNLILVSKLVSVLPHLLLILLSMTFIKREYGFLCSSIFAYSVIYMPKMIFFGTQVRMYSWSMFFVIMAIIYSHQIYKEGKKKNWTIFLLLSLCAAYTHYFALIAVMFVYLYLLFTLVRRDGVTQLWRWCICTGITVVLYIPWLVVALWQILNQEHLSDHANWIPPITLKQIIGFYSFLTTPSYHDLLDMIVCLFMTVLIVLVCVEYMMKRRKNRKIEMSTDDYMIFAGMIALGGEILFGIVTSLVLQPVFAARYIVCGAGGFWLSFCYAFSRCKKKTIIYLGVTIMLICGIVNVVCQILQLM